MVSMGAVGSAARGRNVTREMESCLSRCITHTGCIYVVGKKPFCTKCILSRGFLTKSHLALGPILCLDILCHGCLSSKRGFDRIHFVFTFWTKSYQNRLFECLSEIKLHANNTKSNNLQKKRSDINLF
jgi:hypothetical protein